MASACKQDSCTVGETGKCLLNNDPATCSHRFKEGDGINLGEEIAPLKEPAKRPRFPLSLSLTPEQVRELSSRRYCRVVGILGAPDAGKTAALVSLYLLLSRDKLVGYRFADSRTLMAFDEISHGARRWNEGNLPDQLTAHTELADDRSAGFLHLRLVPNGGEPVDLLLPDLPGEWTTQLIDNDRSDRFQFLKGADVVWLMLDGQQLTAPATRQLALHRTKLLLGRVSALVSSKTPVILVITRRDAGALAKAARDDLEAEARSRNLNIQIVEIASFSDEEQSQIKPGEGIVELIAATTPGSEPNQPFWPEKPTTSAHRAVLRFDAESSK